MGFFKQLLSPDFMPHGFCYLWDPRIVWLHVVSDGLIALSYYCIPVVFIYFIRKNRALPFNRIFWMFGTFILACGTTHLMEIWNVWHGSYLVAGVIKAITATVSVITVAMLMPLVPKVISLPGRMHLQEENRKLEREIAERKRADVLIETPLRRRVTGGFITALLLTIFIGFSSWRNARLAAEDADRVVHTYAVMDTLELTSKHVIEVETSARTFALTGQDPLLAHYEAARKAVAQDEDALRHLTADNPKQQRRLDVLEPQIRAALEFAESLVAKRRQTRVFPGSSEILETERLMNAVRTTGQAMKAEEMQLLSQRTQRTEAGRRLTSFIIVVGIFVGAGLLALARLAVNREINVSTRARAQVSILNAELEQRVEQRTAALQSEISERKRTEEALRQSDARRGFALETAKLGDWELDLTTMQATRSLRHDEIFGYQSLLPEWSFDIFLRHIHPDDRERVRENFQSCTNQGTKWEFECRIVCPSGDIRWIWACGDHYRDASGDPTRMFGIVGDITERKRVEEALREQAKVLDLAQVLVRDMENRVVLWNLGAQKLYGFAKEEAVGRNAHKLLHTEFPEPMEKIGEKLQLTGTWEGELVHRKRDGGRIVVSSLWVLHRDAKGEPVRILEANIDITARKQVEEQVAGQAEELSRQTEELARSHQALEAQTLMLQSVLDSMTEGLAAADEQGKFVLWNTAAEKILGLGATNLPSQKWTEHYGLFQPDAVTPFPADQIPLVRAIRGEVSTTEMFVRNPELAEGVWIEVSAGPLKDKHGAVRGGVAAFRDITRSRADEREIRRLNEELEHRVVERTAQLAAANQELEAFSYSVSHDLRAPLRHISGFSQMLVEEFGSTLDPSARHYLDRIQAGTHKMGLLVDELLNLARVGRHALNLQTAGLNAIVAEMLAILQPDTEGRQVEWAIADLPAVECDPVLVKQIFQNLLSNALKFTRPRAHAVIEVNCREEDGQPVFMVRDNGIGFSMKYVDKLFGVFQRLHRAEDFEGTGIGLATVQRIVHKHGGRVWAEGELDKSATFYFTLGVGNRVATKSNGAMAGGQS